MKKLYLKDIAQNLGLSKITVSLVINNKGDENKISVSTQKNIVDFAVEILLDTIESRNSSINKKMILKPEFVIRKSCGSV